MIVLFLQIAAVVVFVGVSAVAGVLLRRDPVPEKAERLSRVAHLAFWLCLGVPIPVGLVYPGAGPLDDLVGLPHLPLDWGVRIVGALLLLAPSMYLMAAANLGLGQKGRGAMAFKLTSSVVSENVYALVRNPMALGYYLGCLALPILFASSWMLVYVVAGIIPAHLFYLKYFEERELRIRYGESYEAYRATTPFLIPRLSQPKL